MRRALAWIAFVLAVMIAIRGFAVEGLFHEHLWNGEGVARLAAFTAIYWVAAGLLLWIRPRWFFPAAAIFALAYSERWCAEFFSPWAPLAVLFILWACFLLGRKLFPRIDAVLATLVGLSMWIFLISIAVHFPVNRPAVYAAAFATPYFARSAWRPLSISRATAGHALLIFVLMLHWLVALKPEAGSDALSMHLAIPAMIAHDSRFAFDFEHYTWALMPMGGDFAFTAAYLLGGEAAARLLNFAVLAIITLIVYRICLRWMSPGRAALASALFASTPLVQLVTGSLFVENVWAALVAGAGIALWTGEIVAGAILLGAAFSTKLGTSAYLLPAIVLAGLALRKSEHRHRTAATALALLAVFAAPPYLYAWITSQNPIFPFANAFFRSPYLDSTFSFTDIRYRPTHQWQAFYGLTFRSSNFMEAQGGAMGFQYFLLLAPLLVLLNRKAPRAPVLFGVAGAVITFLSLPNLRYLYPALPLISIGIGWLLCESPALTIGAVPILALNIWFMPASNWSHAEFTLFTREQFDQYVRVLSPQRNLVDVLNHVAPGEPVAFLNGDPIAGLHAKAYSDQWHTFKFWRQYLAADDPAKLSRLFHDAGVVYVIAPSVSETKLLAHFLDEWTVPTGYVSSNYELRRLVDQRVIKPPDTRPLPPGTYDDLNERIEYIGSWLHDEQFAESAGKSITYSKQRGDRVRFYFSGGSITYVYTKALNRGVAELWIDGKLRQRVDLYSQITQWQQRAAIDGIEPGPHVLELRVTGRKNRKSSDVFVDLDQFVVGN